jgi:DNA invertase Pin-like site-specific DNA recombinase
MLEIMEMLSIARDKGIFIYAVKGGWELNGSIQSKVMAMAFSIAAEIERDLISKRTKEALKARKAQGVKLGRPKGPGKSKLDKYREEIIALLKNGSSKAYVAKKYGTTQPNLYNWLKKNNINAKPDLTPIIK